MDGRGSCAISRVVVPGNPRGDAGLFSRGVILHNLLALMLFIASFCKDGFAR